MRINPFLAATLGLSLVVACGGDDDGVVFVDSGPIIDGAAAADAPPMDDATPVNCTADRQEYGENSNDLFSDTGMPEPSGQTVATGTSFTICGEINPSEFVTDPSAGNYTDADFYEFTVGGTADLPVRVELTSPNGASLTDFSVSLWNPAGVMGPELIQIGDFTQTYALATDVELPPGTYWVAAFAGEPAPSAPVGYTITVRENPFVCIPKGPNDTPTFVEANDGGTNRGNDMLAVTYGDTGGVVLTADATDAPEPTNVTTADGMTYHFRGTSADIGNGGDEYLDRDTFAFLGGADTTEMTVILAWDDAKNADLDMYLTKNLDPNTIYGSGTIIGTDNDEVFTVIVPPNESFWLWAATYDDPTLNEVLPVTYDLTICSRNFTP